MKQQIAGRQKHLCQIMAGFLLGMALLGSLGCACSDGVPRRMEADYGRSVTNARLEQMVTPPNAVDPAPPVGMAPTTAKNIGEKYDKSFKDKEQPKVIQLQVQ